MFGEAGLLYTCAVRIPRPHNRLLRFSLKVKITVCGISWEIFRAVEKSRQIAKWLMERAWPCVPVDAPLTNRLGVHTRVFDRGSYKAASLCPSVAFNLCPLLCQARALQRHPLILRESMLGARNQKPMLISCVRAQRRLCARRTGIGFKHPESIRHPVSRTL